MKLRLVEVRQRKVQRPVTLRSTLEPGLDLAMVLKIQKPTATQQEFLCWQLERILHTPLSLAHLQHGNLPSVCLLASF